MDANAVNQIIAALGVIHNPSSTNDLRHEAQQFLNQVEHEEESPYWGYQLASLPKDSPSSAVIHHFGLTLLQRSIRSDFDNYDIAKGIAVRDWTIELANKVTFDDPTYIREKIASIWVDILKRCWGKYLESNALRDPNLNVSKQSKSKDTVSTNTNDSENSKNDDSENNNSTLNDTQQDEEIFAISWQSMDKDLLNLWEFNPATKELCLLIFRTLFEDIYILDDPIATRRSQVLSLLCSEILVPREIWEKTYHSNTLIESQRASDDGWLIKWLSLIKSCLTTNDISHKQEELHFVNRTLSTLKNSIHWLMPEALIQVDLLSIIGQCLLVDNVQIKILSIDCFHALYVRHYSKYEDFLALVAPVFQTDALLMLLNVYRLIKLDIDDIDSEEYSLLKKLVELTVSLSSYFQPSSSSKNSNKFDLPKNSDILTYFKLTVETTCNDSLIVSGLSLGLWANILRMDSQFTSTYPEFLTILPELLEIVANKFVNYDILDSDNPSQRFLEFDFDVKPDAQAFVHSYRRSLDDIIRITACILPNDSLSWLQSRLSNFFNSELGMQCLTQSKFKYENGADPAYVACIQQLDITDACLKGISRWVIWYDRAQEKSNNVLGKEEIIEQKESKYRELLLTVANLLNQLLQVEFADPLLQKRHFQTLVQFCPHITELSRREGLINEKLKNDKLAAEKSNQSNDSGNDKEDSSISATDLLLRLIEKMFKVISADSKSIIKNQNSNNSLTTDEIDEKMDLLTQLKSSVGTELNRVAFMSLELLAPRYDQLESLIKQIVTTSEISTHDIVSIKSFLLVISQRCSHITNREEKFSSIVDIDLNAWNDNATIQGLQDLHWFMERLGIVQIAEYFKKRDITPQTTNLLGTEMDEEGRALKKKLKKQWEAIFPIRATRVYLQYCIEGLDKESPQFKNLLELWKPRILQFLPHILRLISQIQSYHDPNKWEGLPAEVQAFVKHSCMEHIWHQGISAKSKDSFLEETDRAARTVRDFADSVGHIVRYTREYAYLAIGSISNFSDTLYSVPQIPELLWGSIAGDTIGITLHSWRHMIQGLVRTVIQNCPISHIDSFLIPFLNMCLPTIDSILVENWNKISNTTETGNTSDDDILSEEMLEEHLLRQLSAVVEKMIIDLIGQVSLRSGNLSLGQQKVMVRNAIFNNVTTLENLLQLLKHLLTFNDAKCCFNAILIFRGFLRDIILKDDTLDQWIAAELIPICVELITAPKLQEFQLDVAMLLTEIYVHLSSKHKDFPKMILQRLINISDRATSALDRLFGIGSMPLKQQRQYMLQLVLNSQNEVVQEQQRRIAINRKKKNTGETDLINNALMNSTNEDDNNGGILSNLFEQ